MAVEGIPLCRMEIGGGNPQNNAVTAPQLQKRWISTQDFDILYDTLVRLRSI